eukprot:1592031-Amphidinium_carterae.1
MEVAPTGPGPQSYNVPPKPPQTASVEVLAFVRSACGRREIWRRVEPGWGINPQERMLTRKGSDSFVFDSFGHLFGFCKS